MSKKIKKPELLAPAGNIEKMKIAFLYGADAVYFGIPNFSLRVRINDFTIGKIKKSVEYAHSLNKKAYVTVNIFAHNRHIDKLPSHVRQLKKIKPDGLFITDPGIMEEIKKIWPKANIILSTQANCTNWRSAKFWFEQGMSRVILGREVGFKEMKEIRKKVPKLELECFVHGALCMAYSGRCFLSKLFNDRSANLGDCSQPCRWPYELENIKAENHPDKLIRAEEDKHGTYIFNSKDLCLVKRLPELMSIGMHAFKIEGRAKSVYYLANVVGAYRRAIDLIAEGGDKKIVKKELDYLYKELNKKLFHRGYTEGFIFGNGKMAQNLDNSHEFPKWEFCGEVVKSSEGKIAVKVHNSLKVGDMIEIVRPPYDVLEMKIKKIVDADTAVEVKVAHGGQKKVVEIEVKEDVFEGSVLRRKL